MSCSGRRWYAAVASVRRRAGAVLAGLFGLAVAFAGVTLSLTGGHHSVQHVYLENDLPVSVVVEKFTLKCDVLTVGRLSPGESRGFTFKRSCGGDAAYEVTFWVGSRLEKGQACYVGKWPRVSTVSIGGTSGLVKCKRSGLVQVLLDWWRA